MHAGNIFSDTQLGGQLPTHRCQSP